MRIGTANVLSGLKLSKEIVNRLLEPWMWVDQVVTSTEWSNFFHLRCNPAAQYEIRTIAEMMRDALELSVPVELGVGEWHIPYTVSKEGLFFDRIVVSAASCARASYSNHDGFMSSLQADMVLYDRLVNGGHMSPLEHQARCEEWNMFCANFRGFRQNRDFIERGEYVI